MEKRLEFLISKAKFDLTEEEKAKYKEDWETFKKQLELLDNFDLSNVEILRQPFEKVEDFLRSDEPEQEDTKGIMQNASATKDGYIFLKKKEDK